MVKSGSMKYFILLWTNVLFCRILTGKKKLHTKRNSKPSMFLFFVSKNLNGQANKKKETKCPLEEQKKLHNGEIKVNEIFYSSLNKCSILSDSQRENKSYSLKGTQNLTCFFFLVSKNLKRQAKKKRNEMPTGRTKKLHNGEIRVNEIFYSSLNKCSILSDSNWEKKLLTKSNSKPNMFLFLFRKTWTDKQTKKRKNEMLTRRTKKTPKWWNQGQWNILFFSEQMFYFVGFSLENKSYSLKGTQNLTCFFFFVSKNLNGQPKKKRNEMLTRKTKKTPKWWNQGQWNILFFSEQMFYFVGF